MSIERGRVALVTGSTSGIGREVARSLAVAGAGVVVTGRDEQRGSDVVEEITAGGGEAVFVAHDLEDAGPTQLVEGAEEAFEQGVDILVNNGGTLMAARTEEMDAESIDWAFRLNVRSAILLTGAFAPGMAERGWGRIVNVSSVSGQRGQFRRPGLALYGATKAAVEQLTRAWAAEYGPDGVAVNCVAPGPTLPVHGQESRSRRRGHSGAKGVYHPRRAGGSPRRRRGGGAVFGGRGDRLRSGGRPQRGRRASHSLGTRRADWRGWEGESAHGGHRRYR
jgi:NAD(P)-dependent dehydrogenase (short-subunit alcohol dehydrogenase family)